MKRAIEGNTEYIIYKGRLDQKKLRENRISVDELLSQMRIQGFSDIGDIYYGIIEKNGSLSLFKEDDAPMAHALIIDGELIEDTIERQKISRDFIECELKKQNLRRDDVFLMTVSDSCETRIIEKELDK